MGLNVILKEMIKKKASDLVLKVGSAPCLRIDGDLFKEGDILTDKDLSTIFNEIMDISQKHALKETKELVLCFEINGIGRFRATVFQQRGTPVLVIRAINSEITTFSELNLPAKVLENLCNEKRGLILITGTTGSGKSTTVASMIDYINTNMAKHIVTLEDPVETTFKDKKSIVNQREIKVDTSSFQNALEYIMLQTPDIIFIGDIRTSDVMSTALTAAETGQLVIANLHTINTTHTIERIVNFFQPHQHAEIRMQLSLLLKGVLSLRLVPLKDKQGRMPACEVLIATPTIVELIRENKIDEIEYFIKDGSLYGMQTFDQSLFNLYKDGYIAKETAILYAERKNEMVMNLKELH
ncbi:MAG: PilT/PilU family type 4a pilus ATPase [Candidatus Omnitrophica bacterium]|nr:PilT/PilU family type 4a pilus ATPase [Candidatus Omnitrophota bacterium]